MQAAVFPALQICRSCSFSLLFILQKLEAECDFSLGSVSEHDEASCKENLL